MLIHDWKGSVTDFIELVYDFLSNTFRIENFPKDIETLTIRVLILFNPFTWNLCWLPNQSKIFFVRLIGPKRSPKAKHIYHHSWKQIIQPFFIYHSFYTNSTFQDDSNKCNLSGSYVELPDKPLIQCARVKPVRKKLHSNDQDIKYWVEYM